MSLEPKARLSIQGAETEEHTVSVEILTRVLSGLQQMALLFAAADAGMEVQARFNPGAELRRRCRLRVGVPAEGSYQMPMELVDEDPRKLIPAEEPVLPRVQKFISAATSNDMEAARSLLPNAVFRLRAFHELLKVTPKRGERWSAVVQDDFGLAAHLTTVTADHLGSWLNPQLPERSVMTVTGEMVRINFEDLKLVIRPRSPNRELECTYLPEAEGDLLESRRGLVQVTGEFVLDHDGRPERLTAVRRIAPVDLSPLEFSLIEFEGLSLEAEPPLRFVPALDDESQQLYVVEDEVLAIHVFAASREDLAAELMEEIAFSWKTYALEAPENLTADARELRDALMKRFTVKEPV